MPPANPAARRRVALELERMHALAHDGDPKHPEFGHAFMLTYLPHYMRMPGEGTLVRPAEWHRQFMLEVFGTLGSQHAGAYLAPRGYAKSTVVTLVLPIVVLARRLKDYIWLIQDAGAQAKQSLQSITGELDGNERLRADFPHLRPQLDHRSRPVADRDDDVVFTSGQRIQALGAGQKLRGRRQRQNRPDLALIDDLENDESVATRYQRDKLDMWLSSAVMGALGPAGDTYMVGTLLHHDAVLARLMGREGWTSRRYEAVRETTNFASTTWPDMWPPERLEQAKLKMGKRAFNREVLHQTVNEDTQMFKPSNFLHRDIVPDPRVHIIRIAVDPATGLKSSSDYSAIASVCKNENEGTFDVLDMWRGRVRGKDLISQMRRVYERWREMGFSPVVIVEATQAQVWAAEAMMDFGVPVKQVRPNQDKALRAEPAAVLYENHRVFHPTYMAGEDMEIEMEQFPMAEYDDQVDALVYCLNDLATSRVVRLRAVG